jgi:hypothetical protein
MPTDTQPMPRPTRSGLKVLAVGLLLMAIGLPVLYVASVGPVARMVNAELIGGKWWRCYQPLRSATDRIPYANAAMRWYLNAWGAGLVRFKDDEGRSIGSIWGDPFSAPPYN